MKPEHKDKIYTMLKARRGSFADAALFDIMENLEPALARLIDYCGGDSQSTGMKDTPGRVIKAWLELTQGYESVPDDFLDVQFDIKENISQKTKQPVTVKNIPVMSICEHHVLPFFGVASVTYTPKDKVVGLSKLAKLVQGYAKRFQIQEKLTEEIALAVEKKLGVEEVRVVIDAEHTCMTCRGAQALGSSTETDYHKKAE